MHNYFFFWNNLVLVCEKQSQGAAKPNKQEKQIQDCTEYNLLGAY